MTCAKSISQSLRLGWFGAKLPITDSISDHFEGLGTLIVRGWA